MNQQQINAIESWMGDNSLTDTIISLNEVIETYCEHASVSRSHLTSTIIELLSLSNVLTRISALKELDKPVNHEARKDI